jgi:spore photoproduct lyase
MKIINKTVKNLSVKDNGRSSDFIPPSFIFGCAAPCKTYCYVQRHNKEFVQVAENYKDIIDSIGKHSRKLPWPKKPNQCDSKYYIYDIGCNNDLSLYWKHQNWRDIFDFFKENSKAKASFATKFVNRKMLDYSPEGKIRIRFSLMPQVISDIVEPGISSVEEKLGAIADFQKAGYEVHLNFSPVIITPTWERDYEELFKLVEEKTQDLRNLESEVIFLTHNRDLHEHNLQKEGNAESLLWTPDIQEDKTSTYGGDNIRYKHELKSQYIWRFKELYNQYIPYINIRYIF